MTSVINVLARALDAFPNRVALRFLDYSDGTVTVRSHTYRQLWDEIAVAAAHLPGTPGDRVLPLIPGDDRLLILILGAMYRGMIPIPVPFPITRGPETERLHHIITDSSPTVVIADDTTATSLDLASLTPSSQILSPDKLTEPTDVDGWRRSTTSDFRSRTVPGGHFYLSDSPALATHCLTDLIRSRRTTNHQ